jgi:heme/copper-type cytochrome/quinol oxidase subunit 2
MWRVITEIFNWQSLLTIFLLITFIFLTTFILSLIHKMKYIRKTGKAKKIEGLSK